MTAKNNLKTNVKLYMCPILENSALENINFYYKIVEPQ